MPWPLPTPTGPSVPTFPTIACEVCGKVVNTADARSFALTYMTPGAGFAGYQCPALQHFCCTHEHAVLATIACLFLHIEAQPGFAAHSKIYAPALVAALKTMLQNYVAVNGAGGV